MDMNDMIRKKRDGGKLTKKEIDDFITGITSGEIPDYQTSAFLMAVFFMHMDEEETFLLTDAMMHSGAVADLSDIPGIKTDKHSTGGVGDKTTLIAAPIAAAAGVPVAKMSGRGLGYTGGTIDKLEAIPGFRTKLTMTEFKSLVKENGIAVMGQTEDIAKADKILYALRDVTSTIEDPSLIASSIMSKKLASGSDAILLDVKCGDGAFMHTRGSAEQLADILVKMGVSAGRRTAAIISNMSQPLGNAVGNSLEVAEAIDVLKGKGPADITEISTMLAGAMIYLGCKAKTPEEGYAAAEEIINSGAGLAKFRKFVSAQGGDPAITEDVTIMGTAAASIELVSDTDGIVQDLSAEKTGEASQHTGAGRATKESDIDLDAGILLRKKAGDAVKKGETLAVLYGDEEKIQCAAKELRDAYFIGQKQPSPRKLILEKLGL